jgi:putative ABC transport system permease protein
MMALRILFEGLRRRWRMKMAAFATVAFGVAVLGTLLHLVTQGRDRLAVDLRGYGPNLVITARDGRLIDASLVPAVKTIFWRNNITALAPERSVTAETAATRYEVVGTWLSRDVPLPESGAWRTGLLALHPAWSEPGVIEGRAPGDDAAEALVGARLAQRLGIARGADVEARRAEQGIRVRVVGILRAGDAWDDRMIVPLAMAEELGGSGVERISVGALAKPDDELSRRDVASLSPADAEITACSPYLSTIARQIEKAIPGVSVEPVRRIAEAESAYRGRLEAVLALLAVAAAVVTTLGVHGSVRSALVARRAEVGLMRALGARTATIAALFLGEGVLIGAAGAAAGALLGYLLASVLSRTVLDASMHFEAATFPALVIAGALLSLLGGSVAVAQALRADTISLLRAAR